MKNLNHETRSSHLESEPRISKTLKHSDSQTLKLNQ